MDSGKPYLLVVDDEPHNRVLLQRVLENDFEVAVAEDAEEALEILATEEGLSVRLVLSDHWMPGKTGIELARIVREQRPELPFLLLTGFDKEPEVIDAAASGAVSSVIPKPWLAKELRVTIRAYLR